MVTSATDPRLFSFEAMFKEYFSELDSAMSILSQHKEAELAFVAPMAVSQRKAKLGITTDGLGFVMRIDPDQDIDEDLIEVSPISSQDDMKLITHPSFVTIPFHRLSSTSGMMIQDTQLMVDGERLADHPVNDPGLVGFGRVDDLIRWYSVKSAKEDAMNYWNSALIRESRSDSVVHNIRRLFAKFSGIIKQKAFLERRIHRFIDGHRSALLPYHQEAFIEFGLMGGDEQRRADYVLRREADMPALLIELESPSQPLLRKDGEWTTKVHHAVQQIADWHRLITEYPHLNANPDNSRGDMTFLRERKDRLVVIGRGMDERLMEAMRRSRYTDTTIWTYDMLIREAKSQWTRNLRSQCQLLGLPEIDPL